MYRYILTLIALLSSALPAFSQAFGQPDVLVGARSSNALVLPVSGSQTSGPSLFLAERDIGPRAIGAAFSMSLRPGLRMTAQAGTGRQEEILVGDQTLVKAGRLNVASVDISRQLTAGTNVFLGAQAMQEGWRDSWSVAVPAGITANFRKDYGLVHVVPTASLGAVLRHDRMAENPSLATRGALFAQLGVRAGLGPVWIQGTLVWSRMMMDAPSHLDGSSLGTQPQASAFAIRVGYSPLK